MNEIYVRGPKDCSFRICEKDKHELVDIDKSVNEAIVITSEEAQKSNESSSGSNYRVPPLGIFRMARGGKSQLLESIFFKLKELNFLPIYITFNDKYLKINGESQKNAIMRLIANQFVDAIVPTTSKKLLIDETKLTNHIDATSEGKTVVLLIDELNRLSSGEPIDADAALFLNTEFLDKTNRYMIFSSHFTLNLDTVTGINSVISSSSLRGLKTLKHLPISFEISELNKMLPATSKSSCNPTKVDIFGGVPSLIYCDLVHKNNFIERFYSRKISIEKAQSKKILQCFINELLIGDINKVGHEEIRKKFDEFSSFENGKIKWPLYFSSLILGMFPQTQHIKEMVINQLATHADNYGCGLDFQTIVQIAVDLRCVDASLNGTNGPFGMVEEFSFPKFFHLNLPYDLSDPNKLEHFVIEKLKRISCKEYKQIIVHAIPSNAQFEKYDGFVAIANLKNSNYDSMENIVGYQVKSGEAGSDKESVVGFSESILIRGKAKEQDFSSRRGWIYYSSQKCQELLGCSMQSLYPKIAQARKYSTFKNIRNISTLIKKFF
jgi:hypothetical protein